MASSCACGVLHILSIAFLPAVPILLPDSSIFQQRDWFVLNQSTKHQFRWLPPVLVNHCWSQRVRSTPHVLANVSWSEVVNLLRFSTACTVFEDQLFWLALFVIPLVSLSIFGRTVQRIESLKQPPVKRDDLFPPEVSFVTFSSSL